MSLWSWKAGLAGAAILAATAYAVAQMPGHHGMHGAMGAGAHGQMGMNGPMHGQMSGTQAPMQAPMHGQMQGGHGMHGGMGPQAMTGLRAGAGRPTLPGQDAFGAIQEVVQILQTDPNTDWSKVNIAALREHLIDMNEVTLRANASERALPNGVEIAVTGQGRTLAAIKRMVPAHVRELARLGWNATTEELPDGVKLTVVSADGKEAVKLKALGFMGIMVQGGHHQPHHLMMAKGEFSH
ncbi:MAG: hypothetical protein WEA28_08970 [Xanthobacteraceae bacterium]